MLIWSIVGVPKVCRFLYCTNCTNDRKNKWHFFLSFLATNQLPLSPVQIQPSPPYYRQPSQDDGRKVYIYILDFRHEIGIICRCVFRASLRLGNVVEYLVTVPSLV